MPFGKSLQGVKAIGLIARDQRTFRCGFTRARRGVKWETQSPSASVSGTAAVVAFRLRSNRHSACSSLFRSPNR
jgi:phage host-nuclease inhibitor protein Gam